MKKIIPGLLIVVFTILGSPILRAQEVEMADTMRSEGKIYVIVAIILIVLIGLIGYLFRLDRKVKQLEDRVK
jgi:CcmD family protein